MIISAHMVFFCIMLYPSYIYCRMCVRGPKSYSYEVSLDTWLVGFFPLWIITNISKALLSRGDICNPTENRCRVRDTNKHQVQSAFAPASVFSLSCLLSSEFYRLYYIDFEWIPERKWSISRGRAGASVTPVRYKHLWQSMRPVPRLWSSLKVIIAGPASIEFNAPQTLIPFSNFPLLSVTHKQKHKTFLRVSTLQSDSTCNIWRWVTAEYTEKFQWAE